MIARSWLGVLLWVGLSTCVSAQVKPLIHDASDPFFENVEIPELRILIEPRQMDRLLAAPREYVVGVLVENNTTFHGSVGVKLKGAAGSYRNWDDRPALTVSLKKFAKKADFHGLKKFHLNNSVQDSSFLNEFVSSELCRQAGLPAPRVTYARLWLNDRDVGFYVLKEGFDELFIKRYFPNAKGNLYEGPFCADIDAPLEKEFGTGPDDRSDLKAILDASAIPDQSARHRALEQVVDFEMFARFMAMERITCHWDGYCNNRNNYRIYFHNGRAVFLPSGMDQMFGSPGQGLFDGGGARVASALWNDPEFRTTYFKCASESIRGIAAVDALLARIDFVNQKIQPVLKKYNEGWAHRQANDARSLIERLKERSNFLQRHIAAERANLPQEFDENGVAVLREWYPHTLGGQPALAEAALDGRPTLHIRAGDASNASWRRKVLLGPGVYTLSADVRLKDVVAPDDGLPGVGIGVSGTPRLQKLSGSSKQTASYTFEVREDRRQAELILELKAKSGEVWFDADSLKLTRKPLP